MTETFGYHVNTGHTTGFSNWCASINCYGEQSINSQVYVYNANGTWTSVSDRTYQDIADSDFNTTNCTFVNTATVDQVITNSSGTWTLNGSTLTNTVTLEDGVPVSYIETYTVTSINSTNLELTAGGSIQKFNK
jgi:hypothetical protein